MSRRTDRHEKLAVQSCRLWVRALFLLLSVGLVSVYFYHRHANGLLKVPGHVPLTQRLSSGNAVTFLELSPEGCEQTERLRVCSHQANAQELGVENGSLSAYRALWDHGVRCFDIDFVSTSDKHVLATHPNRLQALLGTAIGDVRKKLHEHSIIFVRSLGADDETFPVTDTLFEEFARMLNTTDPNALHNGTLAAAARSAPQIWVDLKGPAFHKDHIWNIGVLAQRLNIKNHVTLFTLTAEQDYLIKHEGVWRGPLIRGFMDFEIDSNGTKVVSHPVLSKEDLSAYQSLGPSIKLDKNFYQQAKAMNLPIHSWVVDSPQDLFYALEMGVDSVISNMPIKMTEWLEAWRTGCRFRFPLQRAATA